MKVMIQSAEGGYCCGGDDVDAALAEIIGFDEFGYPKGYKPIIGDFQKPLTMQHVSDCR